MALFNKKTSKSVAKDRLKFVLIHDRANCSPELLEQMRIDILKVISKYMEVDEMGIELTIGAQKSDHSSRQMPTLHANIPIKNMLGPKH